MFNTLFLLNSQLKSRENLSISHTIPMQKANLLKQFEVGAKTKHTWEIKSEY